MSSKPSSFQSPQARELPGVILITGASSGIGLCAARYLQNRGYRVYGTSRRAAEISSQFDFKVLPMDITDETSVEAAVRMVFEGEQRIDVLINNAGDGIAGAIENTSIDEAKEQFETNFFGTLRVIRAVLPLMRRQGFGRIINISSICGIVGTPFQAMYSASKFALEGYSEALRHELAPFAIRVALVQPGNFRSGFSASRRYPRSQNVNDPYAKRFLVSISGMEQDEQNGPPPDKIARLLEKIITARNPRLRYPVGSPSEHVFVFLLRFLPERLRHLLVKTALKA